MDTIHHQHRAPRKRPLRTGRHRTHPPTQTPRDDLASHRLPAPTRLCVGSEELGSSHRRRTLDHSASHRRGASASQSPKRPVGSYLCSVDLQTHLSLYGTGSTRPQAALRTRYCCQIQHDVILRDLCTSNRPDSPHMGCHSEPCGAALARRGRASNLLSREQQIP